MKTIQILMPMGGLGQRFRDEGYEVPKPLIDVAGEPMFTRAIASFDAYGGEKRFIFVVRKDVNDIYGLAGSIQGILPGAKIAMLTHNTRGAAETCLLARDLIDPNLPLIIMDCDFAFTSKAYFDAVETMIESDKSDGVLLGFRSSDARYSYAKVGRNGFVTETAEKKVISECALMGAYCFSSGRLFIDAAEGLLREPLGPDMKEYYISFVYGRLLEEGRRIVLAGVDTLHSFGTPEELNNYMRANGA